jgi:hypothetical protein
VKAKEEVRAQTDEPTAAHTREKERMWTRTTDLRACALRAPPYLGERLVALELGEGSCSAVLASSLAPPLDDIFEAVFVRAKRLEAWDEKWSTGRRKVQGVCRDVIRG